MKHRKLRIAWSVAWGIVAVLLVLLWVRSCWAIDAVIIPLPSTWHAIGGTLPGAMGGELFKGSGGGLNWVTRPTSQFRREVPRNGPDFSGNWGRFALIYEAGPLVSVPDWFLIAVTAALAAAPWVHWSTKFSIRTLFIATTLVAVVLGLVVWAVK